MDLKVTGCGMDSTGSGEDPVADSCEHGNEPSGSIKRGEFLQQLPASICPVNLPG
jgi:hypothetical protein